MTVCRRSLETCRAARREIDMGTIVEFPADAAARRAGPDVNMAPREGTATILILPSIRIERYADESSDGVGPGEERLRAAAASAGRVPDTSQFPGKGRPDRHHRSTGPRCAIRFISCHSSPASLARAMTSAARAQHSITKTCTSGSGGSNRQSRRSALAIPAD
jgi:hypothetical protein